ISAPVAALAEGVLKTMLLSKLKAATAVVLALAVAGGGAALLAHPQSQVTQPGAKEQPAIAAALPAAQKRSSRDDPPTGSTTKSELDIRRANEAKQEAGVVKEQAKADRTAWGQAVAGLQAGIGYDPGQGRAYRLGEVVPLRVLLRNVSGRPLKLQYQ